MTRFEDNGNGSESFHLDDWTVRMWPGSDRRIDVIAPGQQGAFGPYHQVEVDVDGIWVSGMTPGGGFAFGGDAPSAFTIPWPVIEAIIEARARIGL